MSKIAKFSRFIVWLILFFGSLATLVCAAAFLYLSPNLPSVDVLRDVKLQTPLRVYTRDGELLGEFGEMRRTPVKFEKVPPLFIQAVLAAEDDSFYSHHGVDIKGLVRAATQLLITGRIQTGGSTITMQVAKNYFLTYERTFSRKFNEILLALQIERELDKNQIIELYLNKIFLGNRAYGVEAAAQVYYGKSIDQLNLAQWAMIAGIPKAPSSSNPLANPERARDRRNWILGRMLHLGHIDQTQYATAVRAPVDASYHGSNVALSAGYAAEMARQEMLQRFGGKAYTEGYVVYTTLDSKLQRTAGDAVVKGLLDYDRRHGYRGAERQLTAAPDGDNRKLWQQRLREMPTLGGLQAAAVLTVADRSFSAVTAAGESLTVDWDHGLSTARRYIDTDRRGPAPQNAGEVVAVGDVVRVRRRDDGSWELQQIPAAEATLVSLEADTGAILSLVGGFDFLHSKFNRVTQAERQPGSSFKPFIYTAALEHGFTAATIINDAPIVFQDDQLESVWRPVNDTGRFYGPTRLRQALYKSRNVVSVRLLQRLGIGRAINYVQRFGFERQDLPRNLSLALGSLSATPMQMVKGYAVFANGGYRVEPYLIQRVVDLGGNVLYEASPATVCRNCEPLAAAAAAAAEPTPPPATAEATDAAAGAAVIPASASVELQSGPRAELIVDRRVAFIMDSILRDVVRRGTAQRAQALNRTDLAGKTGTTNGPTDTWFSGYAGGIVTTAWLGFDQYQQLGRQEYASTAALPIWVDYMKTALAGVPERHFRQPEGLVSLRIDPRTGLRAQPGQPDAIFEYFKAENAPQQESYYSDPEGLFEGAPGQVSEEDLF